MAKRDNNKEDWIIYDYPGWKLSPGESKEDHIERVEDMDNSLDGLND